MQRRFGATLEQRRNGRLLDAIAVLIDAEEAIVRGKQQDAHKNVRKAKTIIAELHPDRR